MTRTARYALATLVAALAGSALVWPWLDEGGRLGILVAAGVAWTVQVGTFGALVRFRGTVNGFLAAWAGGTVLRMGLVLVAAWVVVVVPALPPAPTLLGLAGFLFAMLLLEPFFFGSGSSPATDRRSRILDTPTPDTV